MTYEYVLLGGLNDGPVEARQLADLLRGRQAHVNLIPFNDVEGCRTAGRRRRRRRRSSRALKQARHQREGAQAQGRRHRRGLRPVAAAGGIRFAGRA